MVTYLEFAGNTGGDKAMTSTERILKILDDSGRKPKQNKTGWSALCPAHDDHKPTLSISTGLDGLVLLHCHAGCSVRNIREAVGIQEADLIPLNGVESSSTNLSKNEAIVDHAEAIQIRATPKQKGRARIEFCPIPASQLGSGEQVEWIWYGYLARGFVTLLIGLWKAGKTTLISYLLKEMESGGDLAGKVKSGKVLVIAEEGSGLWARRRDDVGFSDNVHFAIRPFKGRPSNLDWISYIDDVAAAVERGEYTLVIIDTWQTMNPCHDENDSAGIMAALLPLHKIAEAGAAVLIAHHPKKGDATEGQASRGSGALPGFVDIIIELRRFNAKQNEDRRRKLRSYGRFEETPLEVVIELAADGYKLTGSSGDATRDDRLKVIIEVLSESQFLSVDEIREHWPEQTIPKPGKRILQSDLNHGFEKGFWQREGKGVKGDPFQFKFDSRTDQPLSSGIECFRR